MAPAADTKQNREAPPAVSERRRRRKMTPGQPPQGGSVESRYRLLGVEQILQLTGWALVTLDRRQADGGFPQPVEGGKGVPRKWTLSQYEAWAKKKQEKAEQG